jgi:uncharacterized protein (TIGR00730 family)
MQEPSICVFCGSRKGDQPAYTALAEIVGRGLAERGASVVYGGGDLGLMGTVSNAAVDAGGRVIGIIPGFLEALEVENPRITRCITTTSMFDRKQGMFDLSDGFLVLPGGLGTLDELLEVITWRQLGQLDKPLVLLAENGYWQPFIALIDHVIAHEFASESARDLYTSVETPEAAFAALGLGD